jgi:hypothetical protein
MSGWFSCVPAKQTRYHRPNPRIQKILSRVLRPRGINASTPGSDTEPHSPRQTDVRIELAGRQHGRPEHATLMIKPTARPYDQNRPHQSRLDQRARIFERGGRCLIASQTAPRAPCGRVLLDSLADRSTRLSSSVPSSGCALVSRNPPLPRSARSYMPVEGCICGSNRHRRLAP